MSNDDFFDFMVFWELMFPEDEDKTFKCPSCNRIIKGSDKVAWIDKKNRIFKCLDCGELLKITDDTIELIEVEQGNIRRELKQEALKETFKCTSCDNECKIDEIGEWVDRKNEILTCRICAEATNFQQKAEVDKKLREAMLKVIDVTGLNFPAGQLKSPEFFLHGSIFFYLDLMTTNLKFKEKNKVLEEMVGLFTKSGLVKDGIAFYKNLIYRESINSTAFGLNIAVPYAEAGLEGKVIVAVAISKEGIDFGSFDGKPVKIIFMSAHDQIYGVNMPGGTRKLKFLARVSRFLKDAETREKLININSKEELFQFLKINFLPLREKENN